ncbi:MAG: NAD(P)/FAD-dependent oxidoreductase [Bacteroidales bacterium]|nr:NAD(P)/FAD-dependent oxidoreductase [Bacteroidales bacterium]MBR4738695.1 NAD(P)/FAD-dependent oxidoreductase [Bacteroidales bacterium]
MYDVIIVGAGAAGLMAAVTAAERGRNVLLLEKMDQAGRKLRITGKGRCNLTNTNPLRDTLPHIGSDSRWIRNAYGRFFNRELMDFFEQRGVALKVERGNRVYPTSDKALDIFLALIGDLEGRPNVDIRKNCTVKKIETLDNQVTAAILQNGERLLCRHIVLATGGLSYPTTGSTGAGYRMAQELGHTVIEPVPALVPLKCQEDIPEELVGFQLKNVALTVTGKSFFGEMTFANDGLAGPIALSASRLVSRPLHEGKTITAILDLKPALTAEQLDRRLIADLDANGTRIFNDALRLWLPAELIPLALKQLHIEYYKRLHQINGDERRRLGRWLKGVTFTLTGTHNWNEAIVTQGGVTLSEVNPKTMESKLVNGLYLVGELLDLDADTGGYNLQLAFSTGHAAGMAV